jgi:hypothetical protein
VVPFLSGISRSVCSLGLVTKSLNHSTFKFQLGLGRAHPLRLLNRSQLPLGTAILLISTILTVALTYSLALWPEHWRPNQHQLYLDSLFHESTTSRVLFPIGDHQALGGRGAPALLQAPPLPQYFQIALGPYRAVIQLLFAISLAGIYSLALTIGVTFSSTLLGMAAMIPLGLFFTFVVPATTGGTIVVFCNWLRCAAFFY